MAKILVSDKLSGKGVDILRAAEDIDVEVKTGLSPEELLKVIPSYDGLIIRSSTKASAEVIRAAENLRIIGRAGIGVDNVDVEEASARGIVVMNTPGGNTVTTAEHTISMMMSLARKIPQASASVKAGKWEKKKFVGMELAGKTLGVVGIGRIGSLVVKRAHGLEMKIVAYDPFITAEAAEKMGVELMSLDDVLGRADVITIHTPLTAETRGLIGREAFGKMKKGALIVNCARGGILDEAALAEAVREGVVAGAALDVFEKEPPEKNPLLELDEVILTPHLGASTSEAQEKVAVAVAEQMVDFFTHGVIQNAVNVPSIDPEKLSTVKPYLTLGERMGSFLSQIAEGAARRVEIIYMGDLSETDTRPISQSILKGILDVFVDERVNFVNAPYLAKARGIEVSSGASSVKRNFASLLGARLVTDKGEAYVEGTIFAGGEPRLVKLEDFLLEAQLEGVMLVFTNNDRPGVIGDIGTYLGEKGINIASFELARTGLGGRAMSIVTVDTAPTPEQMAEMAGIENVLKVRMARL
ncbi:MAG: phosphoglycerate dehydrogenase [Candidatus Nitrospinota bacterium M3_3B_026]